MRAANDSVNPVELEIYRNLFSSMAEEMGTVLHRTAYSPNIKERRDFSCAVFDGRGQVIAMGDHMPVHLGSMPLSVKAAIDEFPLRLGDIAILNDPFAGGTHLPDVTLIAPVFDPSANNSKPIFFVASRAHHSDVGGMSPGSMPLSREIFQEGLRIPPVKLYDRGELNQDLLRLFLYNVRTPVEREGDLAAQVGALKVGEKRLIGLVKVRACETVERYVAALHDYADRSMRAVIEKIPDGTYRAEDGLDGDGFEETDKREKGIRIRVAVEVSGENMKIDFAGSDPQVHGNLNAVYAITLSACYYVLRCVAPPDIPMSGGLLRSVVVKAPEKSVVNAKFPAATAGGNVETSQRIVDVLLRALSAALPNQIPAASSGTMNNVTIGGIQPNSGQPFSYYETVGGGMGAGPRGHGDNGVHTHMTNSLNTPIEALERYFPFRVNEYRLRYRSGGRGRNRGGDGIVRHLEMLVNAEVTILSERRRFSPWGLAGGANGKKGINYLKPADGRKRRLPSKTAVRLCRGDSIILETPGGGGWGKSR